MPGDACAPEPLRDDAWLTSGSGGAALRMLDGPSVAVDLTADWMLASLRADTHGSTSGRALTASKVLWGPVLGVEVAWVPVARVPLGIEAGGALGGLVPVVQDQTVDGYTPFENGFGIRRVYVGITWRPRSG